MVKLCKLRLGLFGDSFYADSFACNFPFSQSDNYRILHLSINSLQGKHNHVKITHFTLRQIPTASVMFLLLSGSFSTHTKTRDDNIPHKG